MRPMAATISLQVTSAPFSAAMERSAASVTSTIGDRTRGHLRDVPAMATLAPRRLPCSRFCGHSSGHRTGRAVAGGKPPACRHFPGATARGVPVKEDERFPYAMAHMRRFLTKTLLACLTRAFLLASLPTPAQADGSGGSDACFQGTDNPDVTARIATRTVGGTTVIRVTFSKNFVDNTYGANAVGWPKGHKFKDLVGSDH